MVDQNPGFLPLQIRELMFASDGTCIAEVAQPKGEPSP
jgi:hypothetical protein